MPRAAALAGLTICRRNFYRSSCVRFGCTIQKIPIYSDADADKDEYTELAVFPLFHSFLACRDSNLTCRTRMSPQQTRAGPPRRMLLHKFHRSRLLLADPETNSKNVTFSPFLAELAQG